MGPVAREDTASRGRAGGTAAGEEDEEEKEEEEEGCVLNASRGRDPS